MDDVRQAHCEEDWMSVDAGGYYNGEAECFRHEQGAATWG